MSHHLMMTGDIHEKENSENCIKLFVLIATVVFLSTTAVVANSFFWQGTDISDSGPAGNLEYSKQKAIHDALLDALPAELYPNGTLPPSYTADLDGLPNPNSGTGNNGLTGMPFGVLDGPRGLRIPESGECRECWDGYTLLVSFSAPPNPLWEPGDPPAERWLGNTVLLDMDGTVVHTWNFPGFGFATAAKALPGGNAVGSIGGDLVQIDWCGTVVNTWGPLNNHHDHQREPSTVGYYYPGQAPFTDHGKLLSLGAEDVGPDATSDPDKIEDTTPIVNVQNIDPGRPHRAITDDVIREIPWDWDGDPNHPDVWTWNARDHFDPTHPGDLGHGLAEDEAAQYALDLGLNSGGGGNRWGNTGFGSREDWTHGNSVAWLGQNIWYTKYQDERFHPDNIIADFRSLNTTVIIARHPHPEGLWEEGAIVWRLGPHYGTDVPDGQVGQIIGQHMAYMIPNTLPGAGNILIFDNGGGAGYGALIEGLTDIGDPNDDVKLGHWPNKYRTFSRVLEINPMTKQIVWQYVQAKPSEGTMVGNEHLFFSNIMSGAQRLPNGNTLISEADTGRVFEVTTEGDVVWEYAAADDWRLGGGFLPGANYRAYRVPYS
jgi:hypothetical protein